MQDYRNELRNWVNRNRDRERDGDNQRAQMDHNDHQRVNRLPSRREVSFTVPDEPLEILYTTWAMAHARVRQQLYHPEQPFAPFPRPPLWAEETRAMMVLWIARERRLLELEMREIEYLLGLRGAH